MEPRVGRPKGPQNDREVRHQQILRPEGRVRVKPNCVTIVREAQAFTGGGESLNVTDTLRRGQGHQKDSLEAKDSQIRRLQRFKGRFTQPVKNHREIPRGKHPSRRRPEPFHTFQEG